MLSYALPIGIKKVEKNNSIGLTPAKCFRDTGLVLINNYFLRLPEDAQYFVLCHEAGHILLDTDNEFEADNAGFNLYVKSGRSLKGAVKALSQTLPFGSKNVNEQLQAQWLQRLQAQLNRAIEFDNKNNNLKPNKMGLLKKLKPKPGGILDTVKNAGIATINNQVAFRQEKQGRKLEKRDAKIYTKYAKADAEKILAEQGIAKQNVAQGIAEGLGRASSEVLKYVNPLSGAGGGLADAAQAIAGGLGSNGGATDPQEKETEGFWPKYKMYIIIGGVLVVVVVGYFMFFKKK